MSSEHHRSIALLQQLVALPSVNPGYDVSSPGEIHVARFIERWADALGLCVEHQQVMEGRHNVIVRIVNRDEFPTLLFESHMDTVSIAPGTRGGFDPTIADDRMYGRGTCDTKGSMAAMMTAIEELLPQRDRLSCNVEFLAAVGEENGGTGVLAYIATNPKIAAAVVGEPTSNLIVYGHKGAIRGEIVVTGKAAHTSIAHEGINAIDAMADVIAQLRMVSASLQSIPSGGSLTISLIRGGTGVNIVPEECVIGYDRRTVPGETTEKVLAEIDSTLDEARRLRPDVSIARAVPFLNSAPLDTALDADIVLAAQSAASEIGLDPTPGVVPYGSDASRLQGGAGIDCIVFGPGSIDHAHGADEFVPLAEVIASTEFYTKLALAFGR